MPQSGTLELRTIGHACLLVLEDGKPIIATDPWLVGSVYWRSWWLEKYPSEEEIDLVRQSRYLYLTHSHLDHFHWPSLRRLGPLRVLHPAFPSYSVPGFLESHGFHNRTLAPLTWYALSDKVRVCSVPVPFDDSLTFQNGVRTPLKTKTDFVQVAIDISNALGAQYFVPFASQAFFNREDSKWANDHKVTYEDLKAHWSGTKTALCKPFITMDLKSFAWSSAYGAVKRSLTEAQIKRVQEEEQQEKSFVWPEAATAKLKNYLDELYFARWIYRRGIGWRLTTSGRELFYRTRTRTIENKIPDDYDFVISLPDKVLDDALTNGILTDLGITLFVRVDTKVHLKLAYLFFVLMNLRDYGHFKSTRDFIDIVRFYLQ